MRTKKNRTHKNKKTSRMWLALGLTTLAVVGYSTWMLNQGKLREHQDLPDLKTLLPQAPLLKSDCSKENNFEVKWEPGKTYSYVFDRAVQAKLGETNILKLQARGRLLVHVSEPPKSSPAGTDFIFSAQLFNLRSTELESKQAQAFLTYINDKQNWDSLSLRVRTDREGKIQSVWESGLAQSSIWSTPALNILRDLVATFSFPKPGISNLAESKQVQQKDELGTYLALVRVDKQKCAFVGHKLKYLGKNDLGGPKVLQSDHEAKLGNQNSLGEASGTEEISFGTGTLEVVSKSSYRFLLSESRPSSDLDQKLAKLNRPSSLTPKKLDQASALYAGKMGATQTEDGSEIDVKTWDELTADLDKVTSAKRSSKFSRLDIFYDFSRYLEKNPSELERFKKLALSLDPSSDRYRIIVGAINSLGSADAQKVLVEIYQNGKMTTPGKVTILNAFALGEYQLSSSSQQFLRQAFTNERAELGKSAGFSMSSAMRRSPDPAAVTLIENTWKHAQDNESRRFALQLMGNSGDQQFTQTIENLIRNPDRSVASLRADAIYSLRFSDSDNSREIITKTLTQNTPLDLQESAVRAVAHQPQPALFEGALRDCALRGDHTSVRVACASLILRNSRTMLGANQALQGLVKSKRIADQELVDFINRRLKEQTNL